MCHLFSLISILLIKRIVLRSNYNLYRTKLSFQYTNYNNKRKDKKLKRIRVLYFTHSFLINMKRIRLQWVYNIRCFIYVSEFLLGVVKHIFCY